MTENRVSRGTTEWFRRQRLSVLKQVRALDDLDTALACANQLRDVWSKGDDVGYLRGALYVALTVAYARPFIPARSVQGNAKEAYSIKELRRTPGFDASLHADLIALRNRLIAHTDAEVFPPHLFTVKASLTPQEGSARATFPIRATACSYSLHSVSDLREVERIIAHASAARSTVTARLDAELTEWLREAAAHPTAVIAAQATDTRAHTPNAATFSAEARVGEVGRLLSLNDLEQGYLRAPHASVSHGHLVYRMLAYSVIVPSVDIHIDGASLRLHLGTEAEDVRRRGGNGAMPE